MNLFAASSVCISLFSITGAKVANVATSPAPLPAGPHRFKYQSAALPAGVYFYVVSTDTGTFRDKLLMQ